MATNRRFILIGKIVVAVVKAPDIILTRIFKEITQDSKIRKSAKTKRKTLKKVVQKRSKSSKKMRKGSPEAIAWGRKMRKARQ
ncbi:MAG: hypothetical protein P8L91_08545 [Candidatus Marinimicrobia bacterium]|nr:hypothetical protein [Candidatus Neomarinimicrobiota bacterium]